MSVRAPLERLLLLRLLEEEQEASRLRAQQLRRLACVEGLEACEQQTATAFRALHASLSGGDHAEAMAAEMELAFSPLCRDRLQRRLIQLDAGVEAAAEAWQRSRRHRMQIESVVTNVRERDRKETRIKEQKAMDGWFLLRRQAADTSQSRPLDESFQREQAALLKDDGPPLAGSHLA